MRALLLLILLMQYATVTHATAHHLIDSPLHSETGQCDGFHLQQAGGQPVAHSDTFIDTAHSESAPAPTVATPLRYGAAGFRPRAPPFIS